MVNKNRGQSLAEFLLIMTMLTMLGFFLRWRMAGGGGAIENVQNNATTKIGND